jgi:ATP-binding cassette, subfamily B, bacterial
MLVGRPVVSSLAGVTEVISALILGWVIDAAVNSGPATSSPDHWLLLWFVVFYLSSAPAGLWPSAASNSIIVGPNVMPLVLSAAPLDAGQAVTFFDNDFAGASRRSRCRPPAP